MKYLLTMIVLTLLLSCSAKKDEHRSQDLLASKNMTKVDKSKVLYDSLINSYGDSLRVELKKDSIYFRFRGKTKSTFWGKPGFVPESNKLIYCYENGSIARKSAIIVGAYLCFAISDEQYRGQLYTLSPNGQEILLNLKFKRNYLISQSGVFFIEPSNSRIVVLDPPRMDEKTKKMSTNILEYSLGKNTYNFVSSTKTQEELVYNEPALVSFFRTYAEKNEIKNRPR